MRESKFTDTVFLMKEYKHPRHQRCREATLWKGRKSNYLMICCKKNHCFRILQSTFGWPFNYLTWISSKKASEWTEANCHQPRTTELDHRFGLSNLNSLQSRALAACQLGFQWMATRTQRKRFPREKTSSAANVTFCSETFLQWLRISKNHNEAFLKRMPLGNIIRKHCQVATIAR